MLLLYCCRFLYLPDFVTLFCVAVLGFADVFVTRRNLIDAGEAVKRLTPFDPSIYHFPEQ